VHGTTVPQYGEPATPGAAPQGAQHPAWPAYRFWEPLTSWVVDPTAIA
jgi:hypothetical protein